MGAAVIAPPGVAAQGAQDGARQIVIDSVSVRGNVHQSRAAILAAFGIRSGESVSYREIQRGVKALWATGQFEDIRVLADLEPASLEGSLVLEVEEYDLVRVVTVRGLENVSRNQVLDTAGIQVGRPYSPIGVARAREFIRSELASKGIPFARIEESQEPIPDTEKEIELILDVTEGQRVEIAEISFQGNEGIGRDVLVGAMAAKPEGFWWFRPGSFEEVEYGIDLQERLPGVYASQGYLDFEVLGDTIIIDPQTGKARVEISVLEGPRYRVGSFEVRGNSRFSTAQLEAYYQEEEGGLLSSLGFGGMEAERVRFFDQAAFDEATDQVRELYNNEGYLYAQVVPTIERIEGEEGALPAVAVGWTVNEGLPAYVSRVDIDGNDFTHDYVIRERIFLLPGDVYSQSRLIQSYQQISGLGYFETPMDFPSIQPNPETGDVAITFHVKEKQTGAVNFGTAVGGGSGLSGFLGYDQPNLFGQGKEGHIRWDFGRFLSSFTLSYTDPAIVQSRVSGTVSLFNSRNRFFQFNTGRYRRIGGSIRLGLPVPNSLRTRVFLGYQLVQTKYDLNEGADDTSLFGRPDGTLSTVSVGLTRQTLNHPLFPTSGSNQSLNADFSGGVIGGAGAFSKHTAEGQWFVPVGQIGGGSPGSRPILFTVGLGAKVGAVVGSAEQFPFERFWLGGVQFGERLRGYDETTITPFGFFPENSNSIPQIDRLGDAFMRLSAEYAIRFNDNLSISTFYEAGNVWREASDIDPSRLFRGAGFGIQLVTPFGPLGLDYAYGFDKPIPGWQLHFRLGPGF